MKVLVADDHFLFLDGVVLLLSTLDFIQETATATTYRELSDKLHERKYDVVLLDIHFGAHDGREILPDLKLLDPNMKIIALTSHGDSATIRSSLKVGFDGYLLKIDGRQEIENALKTVILDEKYLSPKSQRIFFGGKTPNMTVELTDRESEILQMIVYEKTTKEIADQLFLSEKTVETHRGNIMLKLEARNIAGVVRKAIMLGLAKF